MCARLVFVLGFFPLSVCLLKQAVVNYDEVKNFIRQQVIKIFDGKDMCKCTLCEYLVGKKPALYTRVVLSHKMHICVSRMALFVLWETAAPSSVDFFYSQCFLLLPRENGLLHVSHADASRDGGVPGSAWASRERWNSR